jgi:predicted RNase H-like HicB family nuclease
MPRSFTAVIEHDAASGLYVGTVPGLPGAHTQGATLEELRDNPREVIDLVLDEMSARGEDVEPTTFLGLPQIAVAPRSAVRSSPGTRG